MMSGPWFKLAAWIASRSEQSELQSPSMVSDVFVTVNVRAWTVVQKAKASAEVIQPIFFMASSRERWMGAVTTYGLSTVRLGGAWLRQFGDPKRGMCQQICR